MLEADIGVSKEVKDKKSNVLQEGDAVKVLCPQGGVAAVGKVISLDSQYKLVPSGGKVGLHINWSHMAIFVASHDHSIPSSL